MNSQYTHAIKASLDTLVKTFIKYPNTFFTERDIHYFIREQLLKNKVPEHAPIGSSNGKDKSYLIHSEYPYKFRIRYKMFSAKRWKPRDSLLTYDAMSQKKRKNSRRPFYDLVILNPDVIKDLDIDRVTRKDNNICTRYNDDRTIDTAFEGKYIYTLGLGHMRTREIMEDYDKLLLAENDAPNRIQVILDRETTGSSKAAQGHWKYFEDKIEERHGISVVYIRVADGSRYIFDNANLISEELKNAVQTK